MEGDEGSAMIGAPTASTGSRYITAVSDGTFKMVPYPKDNDWNTLLSSVGDLAWDAWCDAPLTPPVRLLLHLAVLPATSLG